MPKSYRPEYYEAIIQVRPNNQKVLEFVEIQLKNRKDLFVSKIIKKKFGTDYYISSQKFARSLGKKLREKFDGNLKASKTLHGRDRQKSTLLYRSTICFRVKQEDL